MPVKQYRNFTFTSFHELDVVPTWQPGDLLRKTFKYVAFAPETTSTGRVHLQGFASAWHPVSNFAAREAIRSHWPTAHVEQMKGCLATNEAYCSKENALTEFGVKPNEPGVKHSLLAYKRKIDDGENVLDIAEDDKLFGTYCQYRNGLHEYKSHRVHKKACADGFRSPELHIRIGAPGTGKTRWVFDQYGYEHVTVMLPFNGQRQWFPRYVGDVVLFDDVQAGKILPIGEFKSLTDGHPKRVEYKGGETTWHPRVIVVTSNEHWNSWWKDMTPADVGAVERRITSLTIVE